MLEEAQGPPTLAVSREIRAIKAGSRFVHARSAKPLFVDFVHCMMQTVTRPAVGGGAGVVSSKVTRTRAQPVAEDRVHEAEYAPVELTIWSSIAKLSPKIGSLVVEALFVYPAPAVNV